MSFSCFVKLFAAAIAASVLGNYAAQLFDLASIPAPSLFATGITIGTLFGGLLVALYPSAESDSGSAASNKSGSCNIYVGNLPFNAGHEEIKNLFAPFGEVIDIRMVKDRRSKRFKGYAFVEMPTANANAAINHLNDTDYAGRTLRVNEAKQKDEE
ncbi:MAG: RNA-binding protein [Zetaproteobacteria bacterium CG_4_9_14_3_um_filter_53_7]|nr:MAG: RNA-binding protein [Zetaproteobacteria bacterium CG_4_9_14_3_um_filter_53_7]